MGHPLHWSQDVARSVSKTNNLYMKLRLTCIAATLLLFTALAAAQAPRGTLVHEESIRVSPASDAAKLGEAGRGHELVILETSRDWAHVEAIIREPKKDADEDDPEAERIDCSYPLIDRCNESPYHCLHGFIEFLNDRLQLSIKPTAFKGDIHLSGQEKA